MMRLVNVQQKRQWKRVFDSVTYAAFRAMSAFYNIFRRTHAARRWLDIGGWRGPL